ncbi:MAG: hypothetical protein UY71_C0025G0021 [Parcubacteria group bacterium GW2011_GWB1_52_7]|nr:MAG: hypothetical protein UY64_C0040G0017 [Parcubacteria group bacterium GW2011_GWA1_51_12]KKW28339.1 MAG: hypothetical protein UY71_C0025G0021 [Parcubacteria group bacterium GW2011_GWB1_52_7]
MKKEEDISFSKLFHLASKNSPDAMPPKKGAIKTEPQEWHTTYYKKYPRTPKIVLPQDTSASSRPIFSAIAERLSRSDFSSEAMSISELSNLLRFSCGETSLMDENRKRRAHPSAGARFPIEIYPFILRSGKNIKSGIYHYDPETHQLDFLLDHAFTDEELSRIFILPNCKNASMLLVLTAVFWRMQNKYGERGYRHILIEAGHIGQNVYLAAGALNLKCVAVSGIRDTVVEKFIGIDGVEESFVHSLAVGK